jgi:hypothetical protein
VLVARAAVVGRDEAGVLLAAEPRPLGHRSGDAADLAITTVLAPYVDLLPPQGVKLTPRHPAADKVLERRCAVEFAFGR